MKILRFEQFANKDAQVNERLAFFVPIGILWLVFILMSALSPKENFINAVRKRKVFKNYMNQLCKALKPYTEKLEKDDVIGKILNIKHVRLTRNKLQTIADAADLAERLRRIMAVPDYIKFSEILGNFKTDYNIKDTPNTVITQQDASKLNKCMNNICNNYYDVDDDRVPTELLIKSGYWPIVWLDNLYNDDDYDF